MTYRIEESGFCYHYDAVTPEDAIDRWMRATFVLDCKRSEVNKRSGFFTVLHPDGIGYTCAYIFEVK